MSLQYEALSQILINLGWLHETVFSRRGGLGTRVPWDSSQIIDSTSDATLASAYFTISHLLEQQEGLKIEQWTKEVWDYVFLFGKYPENCGIPEKVLEKLRKEFEYWYPVDLQVASKDLVNNFLTYQLYMHTALWPSDEVG